MVLKIVIKKTTEKKIIIVYKENGQSYVEEVSSVEELAIIVMHSWAPPGKERPEFFEQFHKQLQALQ